MAEKIIVSKTKVEAVADAIREKTNKADKLTFDQMAEEIRSISADPVESNDDAFISKTLGSYYKNETVKTIGSYAFYMQKGITRVELPNVTRIQAKAFGSCEKLKTVILGKQCTLDAKTAFDGCDDGLVIYVPDELISWYKTATNWVNQTVKGRSELGE